MDSWEIGEKALELTGRISYDRELPFAVGDETQKRDCRDQILDFLELDDKRLVEMAEKRWQSVYGKGFKRRYSEPERSKWFNMYIEEGVFRCERYVSNPRCVGEC